MVLPAPRPAFSRLCSSAASLPERAHVPVLLQETLTFWRGAQSPPECEFERVFVDGTAGFAGHARALLQLEPRARLLCVDRDPEVLAVARRNLRGFEARVAFQQGSYADVRAHLAAAGLPPLVAGALVDLGANSFHFDEPRRGFSFSGDGPLDMRFDQRGDAPTAADVVNGASEAALTRIFRVYGEERLAKEYAKAIVREREQRGRQFRSTHELRDCIERIARKWGVWGGRRKKAAVHPATRCFQALRIHVNDELSHVEIGIRELADVIAPGGRLATIAFHSLEDRPIKELFRTLDEEGKEDGSQLREDSDEIKYFRLVKRKAIKATVEEIAANPRSRSARLRCLERIK